MSVHRHIWTAALFGLASCTGVLSEPSAPVASPSVRYVFVTNAQYVGAALHGLDGADQICTTAAAEAGLPGTYKAWLSDDTTSAASRLTHAAVPYRLVNGAQIAASFDDLTDGTLDHAIDHDEYGPTLPSDPSGLIVGKAWTATTRTGDVIPWDPSDSDPMANPRFDCGAWATAETVFGAFGNIHATDRFWTEGNNSTCNNLAHLYCLQQ